MKRKDFIKSIGGGLVTLSLPIGLFSTKSQPLARLDSSWVSNEWVKSIFENAVWCNSKSGAQARIANQIIKFQAYRKSYMLTGANDNFETRLKEQFVREIASMCMHINSSYFKDSRGIDYATIEAMSGAIERLERIPTLDDGFYLIINKSRDMMSWKVAGSVNKEMTDVNPPSYHLLSSVYLTNNPNLKKELEPYKGDALKYLPQ